MEMPPMGAKGWSALFVLQMRELLGDLPGRQMNAPDGDPTRMRYPKRCGPPGRADLWCSLGLLSSVSGPGRAGGLGYLAVHRFPSNQGPRLYSTGRQQSSW